MKASIQIPVNQEGIRVVEIRYGLTGDGAELKDEDIRGTIAELTTSPKDAQGVKWKTEGDDKITLRFPAGSFGPGIDEQGLVQPVWRALKESTPEGVRLNNLEVEVR